ncbi:MAG: helix-turn-helix transcriptional regulator [Clostridia bacterium]|nr:helix-turn-helix transcriptional regulator [Clostridia bacterium]
MKYSINLQLINDFMQKQNLSKTKFCKLCKISPITFNKIVSGNTRFYITALWKIARVMKIRIHELFTV